MNGPASYPLPFLVEVPPEWMLDLMVDLYQTEIVGSHGFGIRHPRARWLRLVVSDREECPCGDLGRWEDVCTDVVYCPRCANAEIALHGAELFRRAAHTAGLVRRALAAYETEPTKIEFVSMADLAKAAVARAEARS